MSIGDLLAGALLSPRTCPHCRHPPEDFEDEPTVVEDRSRKAVLKHVKSPGTERSQKSRFVPGGGKLVGMPRRPVPWMLEHAQHEIERKEREKVERKARGNRLYAVLAWRPDGRYSGKDVWRWFKRQADAEKWAGGINQGHGVVVREYTALNDANAEWIPERAAKLVADFLGGLSAELAGHHATKKTPAQLQREIDEALAKPMTGTGRLLDRRVERKREIKSHASKVINPEYLRKTKVAGQLADDAWLRGGLDMMDVELKWLRRNDADPVIIGEFERLYHNQMRRVLSKQRLTR